MAHQLKVYKLPMATPQARGKAMINLLPLRDGETIATMMPLPEDEASWADLHVMFATSRGQVRRNSLSDFTRIKANGKIAMKLEDPDGVSLGALIAVQTCAENQDVLLATAGGKSIRFPVNDERLFSGRTSTGVRGVRLAADDRVISMSILDHAKIDTETRDSYIRYANARRRNGDDEAGADESAASMDQAQAQTLEAGEEMILTVTANGFGKRSSAYAYRITRRGGQGVINIDSTGRNGPVVAAFPVADIDQVMLVTDAGQLIRTPVADIRITGRGTQGVTLFKTGAEERVVSVSRLGGEDEVADAGEDEVTDAGEDEVTNAGEDEVANAGEDADESIVTDAGDGAGADDQED